MVFLAATASLSVPLGCKKVPSSPPTAHSANGERSAPPRASARSGNADYSLAPAERMAVEDFLRRNPDLRTATDGDRSPSRDGEEDLRHLYGIYHPYFVRGDVNDDGRLDFVLAFVRRDPRVSRRFCVVVFAGRDNSEGGAAFDSGTVIERDVSLSHGDLALDRDAVLITPDLSEEMVRRYRWDAVRKGYVLVRDDTDAVSVPEVSET